MGRTSGPKSQAAASNRCFPGPAPGKHLLAAALLVSVSARLGNAHVFSFPRIPTQHLDLQPGSTEGPVHCLHLSNNRRAPYHHDMRMGFSTITRPLRTTRTCIGSITRSRLRISSRNGGLVLFSIASKAPAWEYARVAVAVAPR